MIDYKIFRNDEPGDEGASGDATPPTETPAAESGNDELEGLRTAIAKERELRRQFEKEQNKLKKQLDLYGDMDPETAKKARDAWEKQEQFERERAEMEAAIRGEAQKEYETQLQAQQAETAKATQQLADYKRDVALERAFYDAEGLSGEFTPCAQLMQQRVKWTRGGELQVLNAKGEPAYIAENGQSRPMTLVELIDNLKQEHLWFARHFRGQSKTGLALYGNATGTAADDVNMSDWDRVNLMRQRQSGLR